jgi:hypothetical protein
MFSAHSKPQLRQKRESQRPSSREIGSADPDHSMSGWSQQWTSAMVGRFVRYVLAVMVLFQFELECSYSYDSLGFRGRWSGRSR